MGESGKKEYILLFFSVILFLIIVVTVFKYKSVLMQTLLLADKFWLIVGFVFYLINYLCRAYRVRSYLNKSLPLFPAVFRITSLHGFSSYLLPMRSGDLTLPMFLKLYHGVSVVDGGRILLRARILDVLCLGMLLFLATFFCTVDLTVTWQLLFYGLGMCFMALPYGLVVLGRFHTEWLNRYIPFLAHKEILSIPAIKEIFQSLLIWFWTGGTLFCVIRSLNIPLSFMDVWFFTTIQLPLQFIPVQGFANSGNHELGWFVTLNLLGVVGIDGVALSLASHIILLGYVLLLGSIAILLPTGRTDL